MVSQIRLERLNKELEDARKVATRTSGQRGKRAREEEIKAEVRVKDAEEALEISSVLAEYFLMVFSLQVGKWRYPKRPHG